MTRVDRAASAVLTGVTMLAAVVAVAGIGLVVAWQVVTRSPDVAETAGRDEVRAESAAVTALQDGAIAAAAAAAPGATELGTAVLHRCFLDAGFLAVRKSVGCSRGVVRYLAFDGERGPVEKAWAAALTRAGWHCAGSDPVSCAPPHGSGAAVEILWAERPELPGGDRKHLLGAESEEVVLTEQRVDEAVLCREAYGSHRFVVALGISARYYPRFD